MKNLLNKNNIWRFDSIRISGDSTYRSILLTVTTSCIPEDTNSLILLATGCTNLFPPESTSNSGYMIINIAVSHLIFFKVWIRAGNDEAMAGYDSIDLPISQYKHDVLALWLRVGTGEKSQHDKNKLPHNVNYKRKLKCTQLDYNAVMSSAVSRVISNFDVNLFRHTSIAFTL